LKGGPSLHKEDAILFGQEVLKGLDVYTLRKGEIVRNLDETLMGLGHEMIKIKGQGEAWTCMFYEDKERGCRIYDHRPVECRALKCWDVQDFNEVVTRPYLRRRDVLNPDDGILKLIDAHERRCSYETLESAARELQGPNAENAVKEILDLLNYDDSIRPLLIEKLSLNPGTTDFLFGRPLTKTIRMFGLRVKQQGDTFLLVPMEPQRKTN
jgi:Fe-S-cluster containining protein